MRKMIIKCDSEEDADNLKRRIDDIISWQRKQQAEDFDKIKKAAEQLTIWR